MSPYPQMDPPLRALTTGSMMAYKLNIVVVLCCCSAVSAEIFARLRISCVMNLMSVLRIPC